MIYVVINSYDHFSTGNIANDVLKSILNKDSLCYFVSQNIFNNYSYVYKIQNSYISYKLSWILSRLNGSDGFHNKSATKKLVKWLEEIKPDVIHLHNLHGHWINLPILFEYLSKANIKIFWTFHDCWPLTGRCAHFDYNGCEKWKTECKHCKFKKAYPRSYFIDKSSHFHKLKKELFLSIKDKCTIITPSEWLYNLVKKSYLKDFPVLVINNGVDVDLTKCEDNTNLLIDKYNLKDKKVIFSIAYPFGKMKGIDYIEKCIEHFSNLKDNKIFVLVGLNNKQIKKFSKYSNCIPLGPIYDKSIVMSWYRVADIFINPTLEEVLGITNIEAIACGTPAIVFDSGGAAETIKDFPELIINRSDLQNLIKAIDQITKTKFLSDKLIQNSKKYSKSKMIDKYNNLINC